jgi:Uma2 family endonuclease
MTLADLNVNKVYTYADYFKWQFEERVELILGKIFAMSAPNRMHQALVGNLYSKLLTFLETSPCNVYVAPFDVRFPRKSKDDKDIITVLQPDICVVCDPSKLDDRGCIGAPDIVVEILSPGNNAKEMRNKYDIYEQAGVTEYWVLSPQNETFLLYTLHEGKYQASRMMPSLC